MTHFKGFTLIELMVTIAVAAILLTVAVPSFQNLAKNNAVKSTTRDLVATINTARMHSMSMRSDVKVTPASGGWGDGWNLDVANSAMEEDSNFTPGKNTSVSRTRGNGALTFMARGGLQGGTAEFTVSHTDANINSRTICISFLGKITTGECS